MPASPLHVTILGAGAMGSLFGGMLAEAGEQVTLLDVDDAPLAAIRRDGLRLETGTGDRRIEVAAMRPAEAREAPDLLIVFTKSLHTRTALAGVRHLLQPRT